MNRMLTVKDVMARLQLSRATIYRLIDQGRLRPHRIGGSIRFDEGALEVFVQESLTPTPKVDAPKVLVIEDDPAYVLLATSRLEAASCQVLIATTAEVAFDMAIAETPDLILLDLKLDGHIQIGLDLLSRLRAHPVTASVPIFLHSMFVNDAGDVPEALPLADGFLLKPFKPKDVRTLLDEIRSSE